MAAVIVLIALIVASFWIGAILVDIFLILVALASLAAFALLGYAAWQIIGLVKEVRGEVQTLMTTAQDTMNDVRGTARFISDELVTPVSKTVQVVSGVRATARALTEPISKRIKS